MGSKRRLVFPLLLGLCACTPGPILTRRYGGAPAYVASSVPDEYVTVTAFSVDPPEDPPKKPLVAQLSERGQAELIKALAAKTADPRALVDGLTKGYGTKPHVSEVDRTVFERRVVLSALKTEKLRSPADRIDSLLMRLSLFPDWIARNVPPFARLESWSKFETEMYSVDLGNLTLDQTREASAKVSAGPYAGEALPVSGEGSYTATNELKEDVKLTQRRVKVTGALRPFTAILYEEGAVGMDLVGTTILDLKVRINEETIAVHEFQLYDKNGKAIPADKAEFDVVTLHIPVECPGEGLRCSVGGSYRVRVVSFGDQTIIEGDDQVSFIHGVLHGPAEGQKEGTFVLVLKEEIERARAHFYLYRMKDGKETRVHLQKDPDVHPLHFGSRDEGTEFLGWLEEISTPALTRLLVGTSSLVFGRDQYLTADDIKYLKIGRAQ